MKTAVDIADPLFHQAKALAVKEGVNFRDLVEEGLRSVLDARRSTIVEPFRLRAGRFKGGRGLREGVRWQDLTALAYESDASALKK
jgi:hypothetical protein